MSRKITNIFCELFMDETAQSSQPLTPNQVVGLVDTIDKYSTSTPEALKKSSLVVGAFLKQSSTVKPGASTSSASTSKPSSVQTTPTKETK